MDSQRVRTLGRSVARTHFPWLAEAPDVGSETRRCRRCGETKELSEFDLRTDSGTRRWMCRECRRMYQRERLARAAPPRERPVRLRSSGAGEFTCTRCGVTKPASEFLRSTAVETDSNHGAGSASPRSTHGITGRTTSGSERGSRPAHWPAARICEAALSSTSSFILASTAMSGTSWSWSSITSERRSVMYRRLPTEAGPGSSSKLRSASARSAAPIAIDARRTRGARAGTLLTSASTSRRSIGRTLQRSCSCRASLSSASADAVASRSRSSSSPSDPSVGRRGSLAV